MTLVAESVIEVATGVGAGGVGGTGGVVGELPPSPQEFRSTANIKIGKAARRKSPQEGCFCNHILHLILNRTGPRPT